MPPVSSALRVGAAVAALAAAVVVVPRAASADQQSVQAQIAALRGQLTATGQQVHQLTFGYASAEVKVQAIAQQVAVEQVQAQRAAAALAQRGSSLRQDLVAAYVGDFTEPSTGGATSGQSISSDIANPSVRLGYISIATSTMRDSVDSYRTAQLQLNSTLATLAGEERSAQAAADTADRARKTALDEASAASTRLTTLEAQLTNLEDRAAAAQRAAANQGSLSRNSQPGTSSQGGPVNGGLVSLVRSQIGAANAAIRPAPAAAPVTTPSSITAPPPTVTVTAPTPTRPTVAVPAPAPAAPSSGDVWLQLRQCESGNNYQANTGNGFYGAYQFSQGTWTGMGYPGRPDQEPPAMQDAAAQRLQAESGWGQWPACAAALGLT